MGWGFRKSISLGSGFRVNLSKSGIGLSGGMKGFRVGVNSRGTYLSGSIPGTLFYYRESLSGSKRTIDTNYETEDIIPCPQELSAVPALGCAWSAVSMILLVAWMPLGIISIWGQLFTYNAQRKTSKYKARKILKQANDHLRTNEQHMALERLEELVDIYPQENSMYAYIGMLSMNIGDYEKATEAYLKYLKENPDDIETRRFCGICLSNEKRFDEAIEMLQRLPSEVKRDLLVINALALSFMNKENYDLALIVLESGPIQRRKIDDDMAFFRYLLGICYKECGDKKKAYKQFMKVYAYDIDFEEIGKLIKEFDSVK